MTPFDPNDLDKELPVLKNSSDIEQFLAQHQTPSDGAPLVMRLGEFKKMYEVYEKRLLEAGAQKWFVANTPYSIDNCPKHKAFFAAGAKYPERVFLAGNRSGKTVSGALELAHHLTGIYPDWWEGRRFDHPIEAWAAGQTGQTTRDTVQKELLGSLGRVGTGTIPKACIISASPKNGISGAVDIVRVRHVSGGVSVLGFKSYDQDIKAFYGTAKHVIWLDEECPPLVYNECLVRTMTTAGIIYVTFTPLHGITQFIVDFCRNATYLEGATAISVPAEEDLDGNLTEDHAESYVSGRAVVQAGWDHAPWLDEDVKQRMENNTPMHLRAARRHGTPSIGAGNVYPLSLEDIVINDFEIPASWPRLYGLDVGWNKTAACWVAVNPQDRTIYVYSEHYSGKAEPEIHAASIKSRGEGIPGAIDPAARGRAQKDGLRLIDEYKRLGLRIQPADNSVEAGVTAVWSGLSTGKIKIFKSLVNLQREYLVYKRDLNGKIVKENDHLMDAFRYAILNINMAKTVNARGQSISSTGLTTGAPGLGGIKYDF